MRSLILFSIIGCLLLPGCAKPSATSESNVLRISQRNEPSDLDPATSTLPDDFFIIRALSEGLVVPAPTSNTKETAPESVLPATASRWDVSADGLTYTFHLRQNARWSNGEPVTAFDFLESYRRLLTPATGAPKAGLFFMVKNARAFATGQVIDFAAVGLKAPDPRTFVVTLERVFPKFLLYAASGPWIPVNPRTVAAHGTSWTRAGTAVVVRPPNVYRLSCSEPPRARGQSGAPLAAIDVDRSASGVPPCVLVGSRGFSPGRGKRAADSCGQ